MKPTRILLFVTLVLSIFAFTGEVFASPPAKPKMTPGAQATENATEEPVEAKGQVKGGPKGKPENYRGQIAAISADSLTLTLADGSSVTVSLSAETQIKIPSQKGGTLAALQTGMNVMVQARRAQDDSLTARRVMVIPGKPAKTHRVGIVTAYAPGASIVIQAQDGQTYTFTLATDVKILPAEQAGELGVGSRVTVIAPRDPASGGWTARGIVVHPATETP